VDPDRVFVVGHSLGGFLAPRVAQQAKGLVAGIGMLWVAHHQQHPQALLLALITFVAMAGSCAVSGIAGAAVPLGLRRLGADPATASSIFLTTATDVVSMGLFLGLAALLITAV
jgi:magnesium transporter